MRYFLIFLLMFVPCSMAMTQSGSVELSYYSWLYKRAIDKNIPLVISVTDKKPPAEPTFPNEWLFCALKEYQGAKQGDQFLLIPFEGHLYKYKFPAHPEQFVKDRYSSWSSHKTKPGGFFELRSEP